MTWIQGVPQGRSLETTLGIVYSLLSSSATRLNPDYMTSWPLLLEQWAYMICSSLNLVDVNLIGCFAATETPQQREGDTWWG